MFDTLTIGGYVAFLCTEVAFWVNGKRIEVSGEYQCKLNLKLSLSDIK